MTGWQAGRQARPRALCAAAMGDRNGQEYVQATKMGWEGNDQDMVVVASKSGTSIEPKEEPAESRAESRAECAPGKESEEKRTEGGR